MVEVGCSPMNLGSGVVNMPQEYTMTWDGRWGWGWGWGAGGGLFRLKKTNSRQELDLFFLGSIENLSMNSKTI